MREVPFLLKLIYHLDFENQGERVEHLLLMHAILSDFIQVPRLYVPSQLTPSVCEEIVKCCLWSDISAWQKKYVTLCKQQNIDNDSFCKIPLHIRHKGIDVIEHQLEDLIGDGYIYYEKIRFTPFAESNIWSSHIMKRSLPDRMLDVVNKRRSQQIKYLTKYSDVCGKQSPCINKNLIISIIRNKVDSEWRSKWLDGSVYDAKDVGALDAFTIYKDV